MRCLTVGINLLREGPLPSYCNNRSTFETRLVVFILHTLLPRVSHISQNVPGSCVKCNRKTSSNYIIAILLPKACLCLNYFNIPSLNKILLSLLVSNVLKYVSAYKN